MVSTLQVVAVSTRAGRFGVGKANYFGKNKKKKKKAPEEKKVIFSLFLLVTISMMK